MFLISGNTARAHAWRAFKASELLSFLDFCCLGALCPRLFIFALSSLLESLCSKWACVHPKATYAVKCRHMHDFFYLSESGRKNVISHPIYIPSFTYINISVHIVSTARFWVLLYRHQEIDLKVTASFFSHSIPYFSLTPTPVTYRYIVTTMTATSTTNTTIATLPLPFVF